MPERGDLLFHEPQCNTQSKRVVSWWHERCNNQQFSSNKATAVNVPYLSHYWRVAGKNSSRWRTWAPSSRGIRPPWPRQSTFACGTESPMINVWNILKYWEILWNCPKWRKNSSCWTSWFFLSSLILLLLKLRLSLQELATFAVASDAHRGQFGFHDVALPQPSGLTEQMTHGNIRQQVCKL